MRRWLSLALAVSLAAGPVAAKPLRYLALGDSYTIGEGVPEYSRWPEQWCKALRRQGTEIATPKIVARTGWTTDELAAAMTAAEPLGHWDRVSLSIGVNNQYRGGDLGNYRVEFTALLQRAIALTGGHADQVWVLSIPDWGVTPFARSSGRNRAQIGHEIDRFNAINHEVALAHGAHWIDITHVSRQHGAEERMLADDGLHPSGAMYALWVERIMAR